MLSKVQITNFLKLRSSNEALNNIKNIIIIAMIKYYKDMNIIAFVDSISFEYGSKIDKVKLDSRDRLLVNKKLNLLTNIEHILYEVNYLYNNEETNKDVLKDAINVLQVEDIIKLLFRVIRLNNIAYFEEISNIDSKTYKCYINQVNTNLIRPIYNHYKKRNKELVKNTTEFLKLIDNEVDNGYVESISNLFSDSKMLEFNEEEILNTSEKYRQIKDIVRNILLVLNQK